MMHIILRTLIKASCFCPHECCGARRRPCQWRNRHDSTTRNQQFSGDRTGQPRPAVQSFTVLVRSRVPGPTIAETFVRAVGKSCEPARASACATHAVRADTGRTRQSCVNAGARAQSTDLGTASHGSWRQSPRLVHAASRACCSVDRQSAAHDPGEIRLHRV